jgi:hypothetical protein
MVSNQPDPHIGLTTAAGIAYDQLAKRNRGFYDTEHFNEVLNMAAQALISVAPIWIHDPDSGERRRLSAAELMDARVTRGATVLILADGRSIKDLSLLRQDLPAAIQILKAAGLEAFSSAPD